MKRQKDFYTQAIVMGIFRQENQKQKQKYWHLKKMLQRLLVALTQVKAGNISVNLLNEICRIIYSLYQAKGISEEVYNNNIINLVQI